MGVSKKPRQLGPDDLVLSYFSLARDHPLEDRLAAATAAGISGIGLYIGEFQRLKKCGLADGWLEEQLAEHGQCIAEIEVVRGWALDEPGEVHAEFENLAWEMADRFESRYLQAIGSYDGTSAEAGERFGRLCDRAADHGLVVGLEFLPFTNIVDAADALEIVEHADRDNGGVCIDIWHHARGANEQLLIDAVPPERVMGVQMSDGPMIPELDSYYEDCLRSRHPPGSGEMHAQSFVAGLLRRGVAVPWSLEVCNAAAWGSPGEAHVSRSAEGMRSVLNGARSSLAEHSA